MKSLLASAAVAAALLVQPLSAQAAVTLGSLTCNSQGATGFIIGSSENLVCEFIPANEAQPREVYAGTLDTLGLDIGATGNTVLQWVVLAANLDLYSPTSLAGTYVGASADASIGVGGGVNVLVGGSGNGFTLQPVSIQAQEGLNAAVGVSRLTLTPARIAQ